jgi:hypothetical protein
MPEHVQYDDVDLYNPETHHESTDVPVRPLWWALIIFVAFAIVAHVVILFMYKAMVRGERERMEAPQTQVARPVEVAVPHAQPLLQPFPREEKGAPVAPYRATPVIDLATMRANEDAVLKHYGWVDRTNGTVHIPIDVAKDLLVERSVEQHVEGQAGQWGEPATTTTTTTASTTTTGGAQ